MCKCCQSCLESCFWHCFEKWWCYDESIALYDEPPNEKENRNFDNLAFWDSVAVIANRSVVTIQPLPDETNNNNNNLLHDEPNLPNPPGNNNENDQNYLKIRPRETHEISENTPPQELTPSDDNEDNPEKVKLRKKSAVEDMIDKRSGSFSQQEKNRKKSLKERRKSAAGLTLNLDSDFHEIPVIRQSSMPRFFVETPTVGNLHANYGSERSSVLVSPVLGNSPTYTYDLKSIVQIENEIASHSKPTTPKSNRSSRLSQMRKKLKPIIIKKPSTKSLPDMTNHI